MRRVGSGVGCRACCVWCCSVSLFLVGQLFAADVWFGRSLCVSDRMDSGYRSGVLAGVTAGAEIRPTRAVLFSGRRGQAVRAGCPAHGTLWARPVRLCGSFRKDSAQTGRDKADGGQRLFIELARNGDFTGGKHSGKTARLFYDLPASVRARQNGTADADGVNVI